MHCVITSSPEMWSQQLTFSSSIFPARNTLGAGISQLLRPIDLNGTSRLTTPTLMNEALCNNDCSFPIFRVYIVDRMESLCECSSAARRPSRRQFTTGEWLECPVSFLLFILTRWDLFLGSQCDNVLTRANLAKCLFRCLPVP